MDNQNNFSDTQGYNSNPMPQGMPNYNVQNNEQAPVNANITQEQQFTQNYQQTQQFANNKKNKKKGILKWIIVGAVVLFITLALVFNSNKESESNRVFMLYMVGSDLEDNHSLASADLEDLVPKNLDLDNNKIVIMVGGSQKWHNFVNENETAIYELTSSGFKKVKEYSVQNMGAEKTLETFLNYTYSNYKANKYDLMFWNHGLGATAFEYDTLSGDYMTLDEFSTALKNSPFNLNNKIETVIFMTCLSGNYHFASVISDYAEYMVASEEISWAAPFLNKLSFIEQVDIDDNGKIVGQKFINNLAQVIESETPYGYNSTYSVIDLSKIASLKNSINEFSSSIDVKNDYKSIAAIRSNLDQYGMESDEFDMVDLYELISNLRYLNIEKADNILNILKDAVVYNRSLNGYSNGLSIYFPFKAPSEYTNLYLQHLSQFDDNDYIKLLTSFNNLKVSGKVDNWTSMNSNIKVSSGDFSLQLTEEEKSNYSRATYTVYKYMGNGEYLPLYVSPDVNIDSNGIISAKYNGKAIEVVNSNNESYPLLLIEKEKTENYTKYYTIATLSNYGGDSIVHIIDEIHELPSFMYITVDNNSNIKMDSIVEKGKDSRPSMVLLDINDYEYLYFSNNTFHILDENGNYIENVETSDNMEISAFRTGTKDTDYSFRLSDLDDGDYYCVFKVYDIYNNYHYSNLIKMK